MKNEKPKFTPGPWRIQDEYDGTLPIDGWSEQAEESVEICRVSLDMLDTSERAANAALIAAAPELLAALESAIKCVELERHPFRPWHDIARAAIAKAKGE